MLRMYWNYNHQNEFRDVNWLFSLAYPSTQRKLNKEKRGRGRGRNKREEKKGRERNGRERNGREGEERLGLERAIIYNSPRASPLLKNVCFKLQNGKGTWTFAKASTWKRCHGPERSTSGKASTNDAQHTRLSVSAHGSMEKILY